MKLPTWMFALALAASPAAASTADPAHLALARQVVALAFGGANFTGSFVRTTESMVKVVSAQAAFDEAQARPENDHDPGLPDAALNETALRAGFTLGVDQIAPRYQEAVAAAYADAFTDAQLNAMLAFFTSPAGQAAIASRKAFSERQNALPIDDPFDPPKNPPAYVETPGERAFDASPAGRAIKQHQGAMGQQITKTLTALWPAAMQTAQADYCRHEACGAPEREVFKRLAKIWDRDPPQPGH